MISIGVISVTSSKSMLQNDRYPSNWFSIIVHEGSNGHDEIDGDEDKVSTFNKLVGQRKKVITVDIQKSNILFLIYIKMKYIKLFEDLKSDAYEKIASDNDTQWSPPGATEINRNLTEFDLFTDRELDRFNKIGFIKRCSRTILNGKILQPSVHLNRIIQIMSGGDEWYYIRTRQPNEVLFTWYKCDQFEGVVKCLDKEFDFIF